MAKMLDLFEGKKKTPETSHDKLTKYGWDRDKGATGSVHTYTHSEHPGHVIHYDHRTGAFQHKIHHSYDLEKHLSQHDRDHQDHEELRAGARDWQHSER